MIRWTAIAAILLGLVALWGCDDDNKPSYDDDGGPDTGSGDADTDTDADSDTEITDTPPNLQERCTVEVQGGEVSAEGDGRTPSIDINTDGDLLMGWAYDHQTGSSPDWDIEVTPYDPVLGPDVPATEPASEAVVSQEPVIAARGEEFGIVWLDGRWDPGCTEGTWDECERELAFIRTDATGAPIDGPEPVRVTVDGAFYGPPAVTATDSGYTVIWISGQGVLRWMMAVTLDEAGNPGTPQEISGDEGVKDEESPGLAAIGDNVVAVWVTEDQHNLCVQHVGTDGSASGDPNLLALDGVVLRPSLAAGDDELLLAYSLMHGEDFEVFTQMITPEGEASGVAQRITWTAQHVMESEIAHLGGSWAVAWLSPVPFGPDEDCVFEGCNPQVFATILDASGNVDSMPVLLSENPNTCANLALAGDGEGWTAAWQLRQNMRQQIRYGRMLCN
ncbi:MAG: hypothetical protein JRI55_09570 [Deltaproteobacteria bacterium]|jgi:hypothetical protein|nr:hypothetical protein [Deltaproteobacteria bacterium]